MKSLLSSCAGPQQLCKQQFNRYVLEKVYNEGNYFDHIIVLQEEQSETVA